MKHLTQIALGFVTTFVLATATQGANVFTPTGSLAHERSIHTATLLPNGKVLVAGGATQSTVSPSTSWASAELYDPATGAWSPTGSLGTERDRHTATLLPNGKVLVVGGEHNFVFIPLASAELYDPATGTWTPTGSLARARDLHTATLLPNGKVLVAAGSISGSSVSSAELYDPATGAWSPTGSLGTYRQSHTATLLPSGKVLVVAGDDFGPSAETYDPDSGTWTPTGSPTINHVGHTATLLPNGKVLVTGGYDARAELYNPATGTWSPSGSLAAAREYHTATLLANGKVLVAGGLSSLVTLASAELFDPATGTWSPTGSLGSARYFHTATPLPNGQVLAAGGHFYNNGSDYGTISSAELYDSGIFLNPIFNPVKLGDGSFQLSFSGNLSGTNYRVLASTNVAAPLNTWSDFGPATETPLGSGQFQFTDHQAPNYSRRFYRVVSP